MNVDKTLEICAIVGPKSIPYLRLLLSSAHITASGVKWSLVVDPRIDYDRVEDLAAQVDANVIHVHKPVVNNSFYEFRCDGERLSMMFEAAKGLFTERYVGFIDVDVIFMKRGWDKMLLSMFKDNIVMVGPDPTCSTMWRGSPYNCFFVYDRNVIDTFDVAIGRHSPKDWTDVTEENKHIWNRKVGTRIFLEAGARLIEALRNAGYDMCVTPSYRSAPQHKLKRMVEQRKDDPHSQAEFWCDWNNDVWATHLTLSRNRNFYNNGIVDWWLVCAAEFMLDNDVVVAEIPKKVWKRVVERL